MFVSFYLRGRTRGIHLYPRESIERKKNVYKIPLNLIMRISQFVESLSIESLKKNLFDMYETILMMRINKILLVHYERNVIW